MIHDAWVEVDLGALRHNLRQVRGVIGDGVKIMAVVKANGYGHGYAEPSRAFVEAGADALAVTRIDEALAIRETGIEAPILLLAPIQPENSEAAVEAGLDVTITNVALARALSEAARKLGKTAKVHVKIDTGMARIGVMSDEAPSLFEALKSLEHIEVVGTFTHFACASESDIFVSQNQLELFRRVIEGLEQLKFSHGLVHAANSAALLRFPNSRLDMVRPGTLLYGQYPSRHMPRDLDLRPTWKLKARVCEIKDLPAGTPVGYGAEYVTKQPTRTAIIPIGFADGFTLAPEGPIYRQSAVSFAVRKMRRSLSVQIRGVSAPVIGRVAMQMTVIDVTRVPNVQVGDEVTIPAMRIPTSALIPRVYTATAP